MKNSLFIFASLLILSTSCKNNNDQNSKFSSKNIVKETPAHVKNLMENVAKNPDSTGLRLRLIDALDSLNNYKDALSQMDILIRKDSGNFGLWYRKGKLLENAKDTTNAITTFKIALNIYPSPDGILSLANLLAETKNQNAITLCKQVLDLRMGREYNANAYFIIGVYYARTNQFQKAEQSFNACINNNFAHMEAYLEKGFIYYDAKQFTDALKIFKMAASINNTYADAYYWMAKTQEALNQKDDALKNYQTALLLDKNLQEARDAVNRLQ
jgi:tetratricopeptide (TPR) repeat protein